MACGGGARAAAETAAPALSGWLRHGSGFRPAAAMQVGASTESCGLGSTTCFGDGSLAHLDRILAEHRSRPVRVSASIVICTRHRPRALAECLAIDFGRDRGRARDPRRRQWPRSGDRGGGPRRSPASTILPSLGRASAVPATPASPPPRGTSWPSSMTTCGRNRAGSIRSCAASTMSGVAVVCGLVLPKGTSDRGSGRRSRPS